jgi:hypothetical protein
MCVGGLPGTGVAGAAVVATGFVAVAAEALGTGVAAEVAVAGAGGAVFVDVAATLAVVPIPYEPQAVSVGV